MHRRRFLGIVGFSGASALTGCCLPPVFKLSEEEAAKFTPKLATAESFLARVRTQPARAAAQGGEDKALAARASLAVTALRGSGFAPAPLGSDAAPALAFTDGSQVAWFKTGTPLQLKSVGLTGTPSAWDLAHAQADQVRALLLKRGFTTESIPDVFVEPNFEQPNVYDRSWTCPLGASSGTEPQINGSPNKYWPIPTSGGLEWHLDDDRTQLRAASMATWDAQKTIRIAHLDTGIDPAQITLPANLDAAHERNFLDDTSGKGSADDPGKPAGLSGWACFNSHGTGTLSLLAGNSVKRPAPYQADGFMGAAANAVIVPVRMADSVIHLYSVTMAQAIAYAALPTDKGGAGCDVISISAGGLPSQIWADAVNFAYENGVVIAAATGDNIHGLPTRGTVWPARFRRVIAVAGVTADNTPYDFHSSTDPGKWMTEGSYGPPHVMDHALSGYSPNTAWAHWEASSVQGMHLKIDVDGAGTSAATPQVAGAAALYMAAHPGLPRSWERAETVRQALFKTAVEPGTTKDDHLYFGRGVLKANAAIAQAPATLKISPEAPDVICSPFLEALLGMQLCDSGKGQMLALEVAQLLASDAKYEQLYPDWDSQAGVSIKSPAFVRAVQPFVRQLVADQRKSAALAKALQPLASRFGVA
jgi:hypothetical protein